MERFPIPILGSEIFGESSQAEEVDMHDKEVKTRTKDVGCQTVDLGINLSEIASVGYGIELYDDSPSAHFFTHLIGTIKKLEIQKNIAVDASLWQRRRQQYLNDVEAESESDESNDEEIPINPAVPRVLVLHCVTCSSACYPHQEGLRLYLDEPRLFKGDRSNAVLRGEELVPDLEVHLLRNPGVIAIHRKEYSCFSYTALLQQSAPRNLLNPSEKLLASAYGPDSLITHLLHKANWKLWTLENNTQPPELYDENTEIVSTILLQEMNRIISDSFGASSSKATLYSSVAPPYLFFFHYNNLLREQAGTQLSAELERNLIILLDHIEDHHGINFQKARDLFAKGMVSRKHLSKLFRPGDVLVSRQDGHCMGYELTTWPSAKTSSLSLSCFSWEYNGTFSKSDIVLDVDTAVKYSYHFPITNLNVYPLRFDNTGLEDRLRARGMTFWKFRSQKLASYRGLDFKLNMEVHTRLMIDYSMYRKMHPEADIFKGDRQDDLPLGAMEKDDPPDANFPLLLPANIYGFNLHDKKWVNLAADQISDVEWNKKGFERLVMNPKKKELIKALVTVHNAADKSTDIVEGKGNGLIVLLHGSPGTGKTLTAETIAETAQKPLYRVTCGDIGTDPEGVESYLETVLYIGKLWGCVVLLDEADVFLEERTLADLQRNALVTVFLRVLEYYDGILILTSNRVGTFDEAFKSRIQLAIHYPPLEEPERRKIWRNFIRMLATSNTTALTQSTTPESAKPAFQTDIEDLEDHLEVLAKRPLNGRQIRNAVMTAKQLATYNKQTLDFTHFESVIDITGEFDAYLEQTHGHTDEQWARQEGVRSS